VEAVANGSMTLLCCGAGPQRRCQAQPAKTPWIPFAKNRDASCPARLSIAMGGRAGRTKCSPASSTPALSYRCRLSRILRLPGFHFCLPTRRRSTPVPRLKWLVRVRCRGLAFAVCPASVKTPVSASRRRGVSSVRSASCDHKISERYAHMSLGMSEANLVLAR